MIDMLKNSKISAAFLGGVLATVGVGQALAQSTVFEHDKLKQLMEQCQTVLIEQSIDSIVPTMGNVLSNSISDTERYINIQTKGSDFTVSVRAIKERVDGVLGAEKLVACRIRGSSELSLRMPDLTNRGSAALSAELTTWIDAYLDGMIDKKGMAVMSSTPEGLPVLGTIRQGVRCLDDGRIIVFNLGYSMNGMADSIGIVMISPRDSADSLRYACEITRGQN